MKNTITFPRALFALLLTATLFLCTTQISQAYFTTGKSASKISDDTILFSIDYAFGHRAYDINLPVLAKRSGENNAKFVSYNIYDESGNLAQGKAIGIVFSDAELLRSGMYHVPHTSSERFHLVVLFTPDHDSDEANYRMEVEYLPFTIGGTPNKLNPSELKPYVTPYTSTKTLKITL